MVEIGWAARSVLVNVANKVSMFKVLAKNQWLEEGSMKSTKILSFRWDA